jgi:hypothetical protein
MEETQPSTHRLVERRNVAIAISKALQANEHWDTTHGKRNKATYWPHEILELPAPTPEHLSTLDPNPFDNGFLRPEEADLDTYKQDTQKQLADKLCGTELFDEINSENLIIPLIQHLTTLFQFTYNPDTSTTYEYGNPPFTIRVHISEDNILMFIDESLNVLSREFRTQLYTDLLQDTTFSIGEFTPEPSIDHVKGHNCIDTSLHLPEEFTQDDFGEFINQLNAHLEKRLEIAMAAQNAVQNTAHATDEITPLNN